MQIIQGKGCLRLDKSLCRPPSDPYYDSVSNGLQILMGKYLTNAAEWRHEYDGIYDGERGGAHGVGVTRKVSQWHSVACSAGGIEDRE